MKKESILQQKWKERSQKTKVEDDSDNGGEGKRREEIKTNKKRNEEKQ